MFTLCLCTCSLGSISWVFWEHISGLQRHFLFETTLISRREVSAQASSYGGAGMDMKGQRVIIVGGVAGGASCAARLRRNNEDVEVLVLDKGPYVSFANCGLPY